MKTVFINIILLLTFISFGCTKDSEYKSISADRFAGEWTGTYFGDEAGSWTCNVDSAGIVNGTTNGPYGSFVLIGKVTGSGSFTATAGDVTNGASFKGNMKSNGMVDGTWENKYYQLKGKFTGKRTGD